jgi:hypothetical protein
VDELLSDFAFNFNLRRYISGANTLYALEKALGCAFGVLRGRV